MFDRIGRLPLPTVAAVSDSPSGGAELSYACDIRIATTTANFGNPEPGLVSWRGGGKLSAATAGRDVGGQAGSARRTHPRPDAAFRAGLIIEVVEPDTHVDPHTDTARPHRPILPAGAAPDQTIVDSPSPIRSPTTSRKRCCSRPRTSTPPDCLPEKKK
ncbi:hypothetical protein GS940_25575 [Rhodococcus hoagii]|nr:hypothetical protein [Prescottella equi]